MSQRPLLIYFADPMCSWCWGFSPVIEGLREQFADEFDFSLVAGGLSTETSTPLDERTRASIREHWHHVHDASGQPFDEAFFEREEFVYNTALPCRALVAARQLRPGHEFGMLAALHRAFYAENRDVTDETVIFDVAVEAGYERETFATTFRDPETALVAGNDFILTQRLGIRGFPALVAGTEGGGLTALTIGYQDLAPATALVREWLAGQQVA